MGGEYFDSAGHSKLDEILALLHNQEDKIASLASEVCSSVKSLGMCCTYIPQVSSVKEELAAIKSHKKGRVPVPRDLSVF